ncbi:hypothetical protein NEOC65_000180 [Neochlamydia sp. AcF65]|nr:hypothetical protein [Neochlamydia sp. AcF65]
MFLKVNKGVFLRKSRGKHKIIFRLENKLLIKDYFYAYPSF